MANRQDGAALIVRVAWGRMAVGRATNRLSDSYRASGIPGTDTGTGTTTATATKAGQRAEHGQYVHSVRGNIELSMVSGPTHRSYREKRSALAGCRFAEADGSLATEQRIPR